MLIASLVVTLALVGAAPSGKPLAVYTTFYPTTYFAQRIAGDLAKVTCPLPPGADPAFWTPERDVLAAYQKADLIVVNGAEFEKWVALATLPTTRVVETAKPFAKDFIVFEHAITHSHGKEGPHSHQGVDGHTWVDPINAKAQAGEILAALEKKLPDQKDTLDKNFAALAKDLDGLDASWKSLPKQNEGESFLASHPAYNYVCRRYGFKVQSFGLEPDVAPTPEQWAEIGKSAAENHARILLWEAEPLPETRARFEKELHLKSVVIDPGENPDQESLAKGIDFVAIHRANVERLRKALEAKD